MRSMRGLRGIRRLMLGLSTLTLLQVGTCGTNLSTVDQAALNDLNRRTAAVVVGNLFANTVGFFFNNALVRYF